MLHKYKIAIAGIGGVGGYYGALLAKTYEHLPEISISFVARGSHMLAIKQHGMHLERDAGNIVARPDNITDTPNELGPLDLIVFCCKAYDLENLALSFADSITDKTILLPLLNGVDSAEVLQKLYPQAKTLHGCTYLFAKKTSDGVVKMTGELNQLFFGSSSIDRAELNNIKEIFSKTGVNVAVQDDIKLKLWEKYSFVSPMATATSALNNSVGEILDNDEKKQALKKLMEKVVMLSKHEGVSLPDDIIELNMSKLAKLPKEATSSLHNDFKANKKTELEVLTGYAVKQSEKRGIDTPTYNKFYTQLKDKAIL